MQRLKLLVATRKTLHLSLAMLIVASFVALATPVTPVSAVSAEECKGDFECLRLFRDYGECGDDEACKQRAVEAIVAWLEENNGPRYRIDDGVVNCAESEDLSFDWGSDCADTRDLISLGLKLLAGLVGMAVVAGIVWGGMLYTTSNGNSAKAQQAITTIVNAVIGLLLFIFLFAIANFLVPGGVIN